MPVFIKRLFNAFFVFIIDLFVRVWYNNVDWYIDIIQGHFQNMKPVPDIVHQELLALKGQYYHLYTLQFSKQQLQQK